MQPDSLYFASGGKYIKFPHMKDEEIATYFKRPGYTDIKLFLN